MSWAAERAVTTGGGAAAVRESRVGCERASPVRSIATTKRDDLARTTPPGIVRNVVIIIDPP